MPTKSLNLRTHKALGESPSRRILCDPDGDPRYLCSRDRGGVEGGSPWDSSLARLSKETLVTGKLSRKPLPPLERDGEGVGTREKQKPL